MRNLKQSKLLQYAFCIQMHLTSMFNVKDVCIAFCHNRRVLLHSYVICSTAYYKKNSLSYYARIITYLICTFIFDTKPKNDAKTVLITHNHIFVANIQHNHIINFFFNDIRRECSQDMVHGLVFNTV